MERYEVLEEIGRNHYSTVYEAHDCTFDRPVAIMEFKESLLLDPERAEEIWDGVKTMSQAADKHIVPVYDLDEEKGWVVMKMLRSHLGQRVKRKPVDVSDVASLVNQVLKSLRSIHRAGVAHGDIRPNNLLFNEDGQIVLSFSPGLYLGGTVPKRMDQKYSAPELLNPEVFGEAGAPTDIYLLGFTALELLAGPTFDSFFKGTEGGAAEMAWMRYHGDPSLELPKATEIIPDLQPALANILDKMLQKPVADRYQSAEEVLDEIAQHVTLRFGETPQISRPEDDEDERRSASSRQPKRKQESAKEPQSLEPSPVRSGKKKKKKTASGEPSPSGSEAKSRPEQPKPSKEKEEASPKKKTPAADKKKEPNKLVTYLQYAVIFAAMCGILFLVIPSNEKDEAEENKPNGDQNAAKSSKTNEGGDNKKQPQPVAPVQVRIVSNPAGASVTLFRVGDDGKETPVEVKGSTPSPVSLKPGKYRVELAKSDMTFQGPFEVKAGDEAQRTFTFNLKKSATPITARAVKFDSDLVPLAKMWVVVRKEGLETPLATLTIPAKHQLHPGRYTLRVFLTDPGKKEAKAEVPAESTVTIPPGDGEYVVKLLERPGGTVGENEVLSNLKALGIGALDYHEAHGRLPTSRSNGYPQGNERKEGLSWRVYLLPFLGQKALFEKFKLDEPWNGPNNKKLIWEMPALFRTPGVFHPGKTSVHVFTGPGTPLGTADGIQFKDIIDGTSNTLFAVVAGTEKADYWTKPGGLPFVPSKNPWDGVGKVGEKGLTGVLLNAKVRTGNYAPAELSRLIVYNDTKSTPSPAVRIAFQCQPRNLTLRVDGKPVKLDDGGRAQIERPGKFEEITVTAENGTHYQPVKSRTFTATEVKKLGGKITIALLPLLQVEPENATVSIDGKKISGAKSPIPLPVEDAKKEFRLAVEAGEQYVTYSARITLADLEKAGFKVALKEDPVYFFKLGLTTLAKKEVDTALKHFAKAVKLDPDYVEAYNAQGMAFIGKQDPKSALASFNKALELKKDYAEAYLNRGRVFGMLGEADRGEVDTLQKAVTDFIKAIELDNKLQAEAERLLGKAYLMLADRYGADKSKQQAGIEYFDGAVKSAAIYGASPTLKSRIYTSRGSLLKYRGELKLAMSDLHLAIKNWSSNADAYYWRAITQYSLSQQVDSLLTDAELNSLNAALADLYAVNRFVLGETLRPGEGFPALAKQYVIFLAYIYYQRGRYYADAVADHVATVSYSRNEYFLAQEMARQTGRKLLPPTVRPKYTGYQLAVYDLTRAAALFEFAIEKELVDRFGRKAELSRFRSALANTYAFLGISQTALGNTRSAEADFKKAMSLTGSKAPGLHRGFYGVLQVNLAQQAFIEKRNDKGSAYLEDALKNLNAAIAVQVRDLDAFEKRRMETTGDQRKWAEFWIRRFHRRLWRYYMHRGIAHHSRKNYSNAIDDFEAALKDYAATKEQKPGEYHREELHQLCSVFAEALKWRAVERNLAGDKEGERKNLDRQREILKMRNQFEPPQPPDAPKPPGS